MSDSGPFPCSHVPGRNSGGLSPFLDLLIGPRSSESGSRARASRRLAALEPPQLVAQPRRFLVALAAHGVLELAPDVRQRPLVRDRRRARLERGQAPRVRGRLVDALQQRHELGAERLVATRATEPTLRAELGRRQAATRAGFGRAGLLARRLDAAEQVLE